MSDLPKCVLCGEPMPPGEDMFKFHGYSGPCPKPPLERPDLVRPTGSNADEWNLFLSETTSEYACVQIADLLDEKAARIATLEAEIERLREALLQCKDGVETLDRMIDMSPTDGLTAKEYWAVTLSMSSIIKRLLCKHIPYGLNENSEIAAPADTTDALTDAMLAEREGK